MRNNHAANNSFFRKNWVAIVIPVGAFALTMLFNIFISPYSDVNLQTYEMIFFWPVNEIETILVSARLSSYHPLHVIISIIVCAYLMFYLNLLADHFLPELELDGAGGFILKTILSWMKSGAIGYVVSLAVYYLLLPALGHVESFMMLLLIALAAALLFLPGGGCEVLHYFPYGIVLLISKLLQSLWIILLIIAVVFLLENDSFSPVKLYYDKISEDSLSPIKIWIKQIKTPLMVLSLIGILILVGMVALFYAGRTIY